MLINKANSKVIIEKHKVCKGFISKATGLMFRKKPHYALIFEFSKMKKISLTNFFVFYPIDVLWLDDQKKVVEIRQCFKPFTNTTPKKDARFVIELPQGRAKSASIGDELYWE